MLLVFTMVPCEEKSFLKALYLFNSLLSKSEVLILEEPEISLELRTLSLSETILVLLEMMSKIGESFVGLLTPVDVSFLNLFECDLLFFCSLFD